MKIVYCKHIPFKGFMAMYFFGFLIVREEYRNMIDRYVINHESIHDAQARELLYIFFYILYVLEWIVRLIINPGHAYESISFEKEAYDHEYDLDYIKNRNHWAQWDDEE